METHTPPEFSNLPEVVIPGVAYDLVVAQALDALAHGEKRFSVREAIEVARAKTRLSINNNVAPLVSDSLVADYPALAKIIERRARGQRGSNRTKQISRDLSAVGTSAEIVDSKYGPDTFEIVGVQVRRADGGVALIPIERLRDLSDSLVAIEGRVGR